MNARPAPITLALLALTLLLAALHYLALPKITEQTVQRLPGGETTPFLLPHQSPDFNQPGNGPDNIPGMHLYRFTFEYRPGQQTRYRIYPTGCVQAVWLNDLPLGFDMHARCNMVAGFEIDLGPRLQEVNSLTIQLVNMGNFHHSDYFDSASHGLMLGPVIFHGDSWWLSDWLGALLMADIAVLLILFMRRYTGEGVSGAILFAGFAMYVSQLSATGVMQYMIDMPSHLQYIIYIANHRAWPAPGDGWQYYHPPLYYQLEAFVMRYANWLGSFDAVAMMRLFSLGCFMAFLFFSALVLRRLIGNSIACYAALLLLVSYPTGIVYASRLDSHLPYYAFYAACLYFLLRWTQEAKPKQLFWSLACFGFAIGTRSNALILLPFIVLAMAWRYRHITLTPVLLTLPVIAAGLLCNFGRLAGQALIANISHINPRQHIVPHLLLPDVPTLLATPYWNFWRDETGRQYFWNALLKSSLFEHFTWADTASAKLLLAMLAGMILYLLACSFLLTAYRTHARYMLSFALLVPIFLLMLNTVMHPFSPTPHFRYIYPALVGFCGLLGLIIEQHFVEHRRIMAWSSVAFIGFFCYRSASFVLTQHLYSLFIGPW